VLIGATLHSELILNREYAVLQYDFDNSVGYWLTLTTQSIRRVLAQELARENITLRQFEVLAWIAAEGEQPQVKLAERMDIEAPTLTGILNRMEQNGWLERRCCPEDRRRKLLRVTPQAKAVWEQMADCARRVREQAISGLSSSQLTVFRQICETIRGNLPGGAPASLLHNDTHPSGE